MESEPIEDEVVRHIWAGWYIFVIMTCLIGDTIILIASIKYKAIKLHEAIVAFIQHIAVSDLLLSLALLLPTAVSLLADKWVFGSAICIIRPYISYPCYQAGRLLICGMTTCKLLILKHPLRSVSWTASHAHVTCTLIWILSLYWPISYLIVEDDGGVFDFRLYTCVFQFRSSTWKILQPISSAILYLVPNIMIIVTAVMILAVARRVAKECRQGLKWQGVTTVVLTATIYSVSFLPNTVYHIVEPFVEKDRADWGPFKIVYYRVAASVLTVNIMANFFIYCLTVSRFRKFLRVRIRRIMSCCSGICFRVGNINTEEDLHRIVNPEQVDG